MRPCTIHLCRVQDKAPSPIYTYCTYISRYIIHYSKILPYDTVINLQLAVHTIKICSSKITQANDLKSIHMCLFHPVLHISGEGHSDNNSTHMGGLLQESLKPLATNLCNVKDEKASAFCDYTENVTEI